MDRELSFWRKMGVRMHLLMCHHCARFAKQLQQIRKLSRKGGSCCPQEKLDDSVKERMKQHLRNNNVT